MTIQQTLTKLLRCRHKRLTFPITPKKRVTAAALTGKYVACLGCGAEFPYDWEEMRPLLTEQDVARAKRRIYATEAEV